MRYVSLKNNSITYFNTTGTISEMTGSSKYNVFDHEIQLKEHHPQNKIESTSAITDLLLYIKKSGNEHEIIKRIKINYFILLDFCIMTSFNRIPELDQLDEFEVIIKQIKYVGEKMYIDLKGQELLLHDKRSIYFKKPTERSEFKKINKTKVKGKMYALFNLKCSRKFIAFYSVSFPDNTSDNQAFECWNSWLTHLRKRFSLTNYIWVTERQKNGTIHFHMLTNNYLPILSINRIMAIIINNQVNKGLIDWGNSSIEKYNGVDVDSIYNSKRHKKTGKNLNPVEIRNWLAKYITKYCTKNNAEFVHLCWHCSRSISILFTSQILHHSEAWIITNHLPRIRKNYINYKGKFNDVWIFCFVPPEHLYERIKQYNNWLFVEFEPQQQKRTLKINLKKISL